MFKMCIRLRNFPTKYSPKICIVHRVLPWRNFKISGAKTSHKVSDSHCLTEIRLNWPSSIICHQEMGDLGRGRTAQGRLTYCKLNLLN